VNKRLPKNIFPKLDIPYRCPSCRGISLTDAYTAKYDEEKRVVAECSFCKQLVIIHSEKQPYNPVGKL